MIIAIFMFFFSFCVLQQFFPCSYPVYEPLCGSFYPSYGIGMQPFSSMPVGMLIAPINSAPCYYSGQMRNLPLESSPEEMDNHPTNVVEYKDQTKIINEMVNNQNFTSLTKNSLDNLLEIYGTSVEKLNKLRPKFESLSDREGNLDEKEQKEIEELRNQLNSVWGNIVLTELFFANTRVGMKPRPLTQYLFSRQFPTGQAFANEASNIASEHISENGWIACVFDRSKESLLLDWIPNNEMNRVTQYSPVIIINTDENTFTPKHQKDKAGFVNDYITHDINWDTVEERLRVSVNDKTLRDVDRLLGASSSSMQ